MSTPSTSTGDPHAPEAPTGFPKGNFVARTAALAALTAALCSAVDAFVVALIVAVNSNVPPTSPLFILAFYVPAGLVGGALIGLRLTWLRRQPGLSQCQGLAQSVLLSLVWIYYVVLTLTNHVVPLRIETIHVVIALGCCVVLLWALPPVCVRLNLGVRQMRFYTLRVMLTALFFHMWVPMNHALPGNVFTRQSLITNAIFCGGAIVVYFVLCRVGSRIAGKRESDQRLVTSVALASSVVLTAAWGMFLFAKPAPIDNAHLRDAIPLAQEDVRNVVLVVMDTARKDHLSVYGYERETTPNLRRFAEQAVRYTRAVSTSSWTLPAHASMLTGLLPTEHQAHNVNDAMLTDQSPRGTGKHKQPAWPLHESHQTLAEILAAEGFRTAAVVSNPVYLNRSYGLHQGFDFYDDRWRAGFPPTAALSIMDWGLQGSSRQRDLEGSHYRPANEINEAILAWLNRGEEPFFLLVNYMDPHVPYVPPPPYDRVFPGKVEELLGWRPWNRLLGILMNQKRDLSQRERQHLLSQYDGEIAFLDAQIGILFERFRQMGIYDRSLIIVTSDHGEGFGERGLLGHAVSLYGHEVDVPLLVRYPGGRRTGDNDARVSLKSILALVLNELNIPLPEPKLAPGNQEASPHVLAELYRREDYAEMWGARFNRDLRVLFPEDDLKLILASDEQHELYQLADDPGETKNIAGDKDELIDTARVSVDEWAKSTVDQQPLRPPRHGLDDETIQTLKALGYVN